MNRDGFALIGCGGGGSKLVDSIVDVDPRYTSFFINTSMTDIQSLDNYDDIDKNYLCISNQNGMGRDRSLGKKVASKKGWTILESIKRFDQDVIYLVTSLGGGSGSSIVSVLLKAIQQLKEDEEFDKTVNIIGILPSLNSSDEVLKNTIDTWKEIMSYNCVNNMMFIDNNNTIDGQLLSEDEINERFSQLFDSIFEIPNSNGRNFDNGNLGRILNSKGCMYVYDLPSECTTVEQALKQADNNSVLAKMFKIKDVMMIDDGKEKMRCGFIGTSFNDKNYNYEDVLDKYKNLEEHFHGYNEENNLVLISGCLPPFYSIQVIEAELDDRAREKAKLKEMDFSKFVVDYDNKGIAVDTQEKPKAPTQKTQSQPKSKNMKKVMKKNLFDMI